MFITRLRRPLAAAAAGLSILAVGAPASASPPADADRSVINGTVVPRPSLTVPWAVSLYHAPDSHSTASFICTATAIGPLEVLTAAHCVDAPGFYFVRVGTNVLDRGRLVAVEAIDGHAGYRSTATTYDVAMLRPLERLNLRAYARLGSPTMAASVRAGKLPALTLYGWGVTERGVVTGHLRTASLVRQTRAAQLRFKSAFVDQLMLSAGRYNPTTRLYSGACYGDSGGPLVVHVLGVPYVVGITSFGARDCNSPVPTIFTSVGNYGTWIATSRRGLPALAVRRNRALPLSRTAPVIAGTVAAGATLTCGKGTWTDNARTFTYAWSRGPDSTVLVTGAQYQVSQEDAGAKLVCTVTAKSLVGVSGRSTSVAAGLAPAVVAGQYTTIAGLAPFMSWTEPDTVATCTPAVFGPGVVVGQGWYSRPNTTGEVQLLSTDASLILTKELLLQIAGEDLVCVTTGTNAMGVTPVSATVRLTPLYTPTVTTTLAAVPIVAGSTATCGGFIGETSRAVLSFEWAIEPTLVYGANFSAAAQPLGVGPTYTLTDADVTALATARLACRATATLWHSSASSVKTMPI